MYAVKLVLWTLLLPLLVARLPGLRRTVAVVCMLALGVIAYGVLGELVVPATAEPPARASTAARGDIPARYLRGYQVGAKACPGLDWTVLAAIGKVESDHGRARLPGVRSATNWAGAAGRCNSASAGRPATPGPGSAAAVTSTTRTRTIQVPAAENIRRGDLLYQAARNP